MFPLEYLTDEARNAPVWRNSLCQTYGLNPSVPIIIYRASWSEALSHLATYYQASNILERIFGAITELGNNIQHIIEDRQTTGHVTQEYVSHIGNQARVKPSQYIRVEKSSRQAEATPTKEDFASLLGADLVIMSALEYCPPLASLKTPANRETESLVVYNPAHLTAWGVRLCNAKELTEAIQSTFENNDYLSELRQALAGNDGWNEKAQLQFIALTRQLIFKLPLLTNSNPDSSNRTPLTPPVWKTCLGVESIAATGYHGGERKELIDLSSRPIRCALDIGCAAGGTGAYIKQQHRGARVIGIELNRAAARIAETRLDAVLVGKFEDIDLSQAGLKPGEIDTVIVGDVLEHMYDPWSVLTSLLPWLSMDAQIIASIPNVRNLKLMESMAAGYWRYEDAGLLDVTHIRFFTLREIRRFFHETGYHVRTLKFAIDPRLIHFHNENRKLSAPIDINLGKMTLRGIEAQELDELCSLQFYVVAGINARIDDIENYRETPAQTLLLNRLALTPTEEKLWENHVGTWKKTPLVNLFIIDTTGNPGRISKTVCHLLKQLYTSYRITVVSPTAPPESIHLTAQIAWCQQQPDESPYVTINKYLSDSTSDWLGIIYAGDVLDPSALLRMMEMARTFPDAHCLYGDDSILEQDDPGVLQLKPDFDLHLLLGRDYLGTGLALFRTDGLTQIGGFTPVRRGSETFDAALKIYANFGATGFKHLAVPILHRPITGNDGDLPFGQIWQSRREAIGQYMETIGATATIEDGWLPGTFRIRYQSTSKPTVSLLIVADEKTSTIQINLEKLLDKTDYPSYEILILDNGVSDQTIKNFLVSLDELNSSALKIFKLDAPSPPVSAINLLADQASGEILVFLDAHLQPMTPDWLTELVSQMTGPGVGAVAPRILAADGHICHSGLFTGIHRGCLDAFSGLRHNEPGVMGRAHLAQQFSALPHTCLLMRKEVFTAAGGLDDISEALTPAQAMADMTLRLSEAGISCLWTPFVSLLKVVTPDEKLSAIDGHIPLTESLIERHLNWLAHDPAYHPTLSLVPPTFAFEKRKELLSEHLPWRPLPRIVAFNADLGGGGHYRIIEPARALNEAQLAQTDTTDLLFDTIEIARVKPDVLVMQRQITDEQLEQLERIKRINKTPIVYELDDLMTNLPASNPHSSEIPKDIETRLRRGIGLSDRLIVSTEPLAHALRDMNSHIQVVPNRLPRKRWEGLMPTRRHGKKPRVGWSGSISHVGDLQIISDVVKELSKEVDWIFMGLVPDVLKPYIAEYHPGLPFDEYPEALARLDLDLALAPLELCHFNECKSNLKLLEYGILGYPVIATDIVPYQCNLPVTRIKNTFRQWTSAIREQLTERETLAQQGKILQTAVRKEWMLEDHLDIWLAAWSI